MAILTHQERIKAQARMTYSPTTVAVVADVNETGARLTFPETGHTSEKYYACETAYPPAVGQLVRIRKTHGSYVVEAPILPNAVDANAKFLFNAGVFRPRNGRAQYQTTGSFESLTTGETVIARCSPATNSWFLVYFPPVDITGWNKINFTIRSRGYTSTIGIQSSPSVSVDNWVAWSNDAPSSLSTISVDISSHSGNVYPAAKQAGSGSNNYIGLIEIARIWLSK